jgi:hypothetical protein
MVDSRKGITNLHVPVSPPPRDTHFYAADVVASLLWRRSCAATSDPYLSGCHAVTRTVHPRVTSSSTPQCLSSSVTRARCGMRTTPWKMSNA